MLRSLRIYGTSFLLLFGLPAGAQRGAAAPEMRLEQFYTQVGLEQLYIGIGAGKAAAPDNATCPGFNATLMLTSHWGGSFSFRAAFFESRELPPDYYPGGIFNTGNPEDAVRMFSLLLVREWLSPEPRIRFGAEAGISDVLYDSYSFTPNTSTGWFGSNYNDRLTTRQTFGLSLRAKVQFPVGRTFGLELAVAGNINRYQPVLNAECYLDFGYLRKRIAPSSQ